MTPDEVKRLKRCVSNAQDLADQELTDALLRFYFDLTGKKPSERFENKVFEAVRFDR